MQIFQWKMIFHLGRYKTTLLGCFTKSFLKNKFHKKVRRSPQFVMSKKIKVSTVFRFFGVYHGILAYFRNALDIFNDSKKFHYKRF